MSPTLSTRFGLVVICAIAVFTLAAAPVSALSISVGDWSGPAFPMGGPATADVAITYGCGELLPPPLGADIEVSAALEQGALGTISLSDSTFTPQLPPDCDPGSDANETLTLSYTATTLQLADSTVSISLSAVHNISEEVDALNSMDDTSTSATVGPFMDVTFTAMNDTFTVIGGDTVSVEIEMTSDANAEVMAMDTMVDVPDGWDAPSITPPRTQPNEDVTPVTTTLRFDVEVPEEADGENILVFSTWVHTTTTPSLESDTIEIPLTIDVTPLSVFEAEQEEGPAPAAVGVVLALLVAFVAARRRRDR